MDCLHPLQAQAANMDAEYLASEFGDKITFLGGIDAQGIMPHGSPQDVKDEVYRIREILGPHLIISPSHEPSCPTYRPKMSPL